MKATVNRDTCIGCGLCAATCPAVFEMDGDKARVIADPVTTDAEAACRDAASGCPVEAITVDG